MVKGLIVETSYVTKSGQGTPMFSRPGKGTCAEYMVFKEKHDRGEVLEEVPEEVLKEQLKNDLLGKEEDVFGAYLQDQLEKADGDAE